MLVPVLKFVVFSLAQAIFLIWSTPPNLWGQLNLPTNEREPTQLLYLLDDFHGRVHDILSTKENLVRSLTSDGVEIILPTSLPETYLVEKTLVPISIAAEDPTLSQDLPALPEYGINIPPGCWLECC
ncbi:hypothetical protein DSO57_1015281 [Entomophthora muscae]|uniref:Uncharacterized protein n=1 Tax=Entomophthora muscae TaxID=34485 RepID=A0ACC2U312_9FUNG|nr:hypothetical protein DSO57_1015281 [Entomophthora muscae]